MSFHSGQSFTFGETPSATKWNYLWENDYALQDWTAFTNATFPVALLAAGSVTASKLDSNAIGHGYLEIARTTLGSAGDTISVTSIPAFKYLRILVFIINSGSVSEAIRFNNDSGSNYAVRSSTDGLADTTVTSGAQILYIGGSSYSRMTTIDVINTAAQEKSGYLLQNRANTAGAANAPSRIEMAFKWANTSAQINRVDVLNNVGATGTGDFAIGSEVVVLGKN